MRSGDMLHAFSEIDAGLIEQNAENRAGHQPDIGPVLEAIRSGSDTVTESPKRRRREQITRVMKWSCGIAACAVLAVAGISLANRRSDVTEPNGASGGSVPMEIVTGTTAAPAVQPVSADQAKEIPFTVVQADYTDDEGFLSLDEQEALRSCVIGSAEELKASRIQPKKEYSEEYFSDHALIFVSTVFSCTGDLPAVTSVRCIGDTIAVTAERVPAMAEALQWWCTFLEVDKADLPDGNAEIILYSDSQIRQTAETRFSERSIPFTVIPSDYSLTDSHMKYNDLKSMAIFDAEMLERSYVHPDSETEQFDAEFFRDHALILVSTVFATLNSEPDVTSVRVTETGLQVNALRRRSQAEPAAVQWWCVFLTVSRADIEANRAYDNITLHVEDVYETMPESTQPSGVPAMTDTAYTVPMQTADTTETTATAVFTIPPVTQTAVSTVTSSWQPLYSVTDCEPFSFVMRAAGDTYDDDLHIETGEEWLAWYESAKNNLYSAAKTPQQRSGLNYAVNKAKNCDILWFKVEYSGSLPEIRGIRYAQNGLLNVEAAMMQTETDAGVYRVCLPVPRQGERTFFRNKVKIWELKTVAEISALEESGVLPEIGEQLTMDRLHLLVQEGEDFTWSDLDPYVCSYSYENGWVYYTFELDGGWEAHFYQNPDSDSGPMKNAKLLSPAPEYISYSLDSDSIPWDTMNTAGTKILTMDDVRRLAQKGAELDWSDFMEYQHTDVGSGLYIWKIETDGDWQLYVGGVTTEKPLYINLTMPDGETYEIRSEQIPD